MNSKTSKTKIHVFIPTFNCREDIAGLIKGIQKQKGNFDINILVIDSSTDLALQDKVRKIKDIDFRTIKSKDFSHGGTRAEAIKIAIKEKSEFIVFTVQDAQMYDEYWLENILEPFKLDPEIACVYGKQVPYEQHNPLSKTMMEQAFDSMSPDENIVVHSSDKPDVPGTYFNSHVNSAYRLSLFKQGKIKMVKINYAEDQYMAKEIIDKGFKKAYSPKAKVYHSHAWGSTFEYFQRYFDEYRGLKESIGYADSLGLKAIFKNSWKSGYKDFSTVIRGKGTILARIKWALLAFPIEFYKHIAIYLAARYETIPQYMQNLLSREDMQKSLKKNKLSITEKIKAHYYMLRILFSRS